MGTSDSFETVNLHEGHNMADMESSDHMDMGMMMYFHLGTSETILFKGWKTHNWQTMLGSCIAIVIMGALYEGLKVGRELLLHLYPPLQHDRSQPLALATGENEQTDPIVDTVVSVRSKMCSVSHLIQTLLHIVQIVVSYFLMLIFMTYNFYLCLAVAIGAGLGYFLFSWKRSSVIDVNEHCH